MEGITFEKAREIEARYFANHVHWRPAMATSPGLVQRLGANALRSGLSLLLVERIEEQMPAMRKSAREQLDKLRAELASLPPVCVDPNHVRGPLTCGVTELALVVPSLDKSLGMEHLSHG